MARLVLTSGGDSTARLWDGQTGEPLTPVLKANSLSRSALFMSNGPAWAWTGEGVYVDQLTVEERGLEQLRSLVESSAARTLSAAGSELPLSAEEVEARFSTTDECPASRCRAVSGFSRRARLRCVALSQVCHGRVQSRGGKQRIDRSAGPTSCVWSAHTRC